LKIKINFRGGLIRKCQFCGKEIKEESIVCEFCGKELFPVYKAVTATEIRAGNYHESFGEKRLNVGDKVYYKNIVNNDPTWFYGITTDRKKKGWCFSTHFEKC